MKLDDDDAFALELASMCRSLNVLPMAGGLLDQDIKYYRMLRAGMIALAKKEKYETDKASKR